MWNEWQHAPLVSWVRSIRKTTRRHPSSLLFPPELSLSSWFVLRLFRWLTDKAVGILYSFDSQSTALPSTYYILTFAVSVPLWKWHAFNYMLGLACSTAITHKNRSFLSYKMEPVRYDPSGNTIWPPIALPQIAFCTWLQVHLCSFWAWWFGFPCNTHQHVKSPSVHTHTHSTMGIKPISHALCSFSQTYKQIKCMHYQPIVHVHITGSRFILSGQQYVEEIKHIES